MEHSSECLADVFANDLGAALDVRAHVAGGFVGVAGDDRADRIEMFGDGDADAVLTGEVVDPQDSDSVGEVAKHAGGDVVSGRGGKALVKGLVAMYESRAFGGESACAVFGVECAPVVGRGLLGFRGPWSWPLVAR